MPTTIALRPSPLSPPLTSHYVIKIAFYGFGSSIIPGTRPKRGLGTEPNPPQFTGSAQNAEEQHLLEVQAIPKTLRNLNAVGIRNTPRKNPS